MVWAVLAVQQADRPSLRLERWPVWQGWKGFSGDLESQTVQGLFS